MTSWTLFSGWCPQKSHFYLNKTASESCRFVSVCVTFKWTPGTKGLIYIFWLFFILKTCCVILFAKNASLIRNLNFQFMTASGITSRHTIQCHLILKELFTPTAKASLYYWVAPLSHMVFFSLSIKSQIRFWILFRYFFVLFFCLSLLSFDIFVFCSFVFHISFV